MFCIHVRSSCKECKHGTFDAAYSTTISLGIGKSKQFPILFLGPNTQLLRTICIYSTGGYSF